MKNHLKKLFFVIGLGLLLILGFAIRNIDLDADPPENLSWSQGPFTDGAIVIHNARNKALYGTWMLDHCKDMYFYPLANFAAYLSFKLFGVGRAQAAGPNTLLGILSILATCIALLRAGRVATLVWAGFACFNYILIMYDRLPVAEPMMIFLLSISLLFFSYADRWRQAYFGAGLFAVMATLVGKAHAFFFPAALILTLLVTTRKRPRQRKTNVLFVIAGTAIGGALWLGLLGIPHGDYICSQASQATYEKHERDVVEVSKAVFRNLLDMGIENENRSENAPYLHPGIPWTIGIRQ